MAIGYISLGIVGFLLAVKYFAVLPGDIKDWNHMFRSAPGAGQRPSPVKTLNPTRPKENKHARISIDPITRIEGHLRIDVEVDAARCRRHGRVAPCGADWNHSPRTRRPRRLGICPAFLRSLHTVHAIASVRAVEDALQLEIPANAQYIRNLILIAHALHDHIVHFYQLSALDWVDITTIPKADPARAASIAEVTALGREIHAANWRQCRTKSKA